MNREEVKLLIETATTFERADELICRHTEFKTTKEKIAFLKGMFDVEIIDQRKSDSDEFIYQLIVNAIVNQKFM